MTGYTDPALSLCDTSVILAADSHITLKLANESLRDELLRAQRNDPCIVSAKDQLATSGG